MIKSSIKNNSTAESNILELSAALCLIYKTALSQVRKEVLLVLEMKRADAHEKRSRASPYEASLRLTERFVCASLHGATRRFISAQADASFKTSPSGLEKHQKL